MPEPPIWITEAEVVSLADLHDAIGTVRDELADLASGEAVSMEKAQARYSGGTLHATGGVSMATGYACSKTWVHTGGGAIPLVLLWSADNGGLAAVIEAFALGQYRSGAISAIATDLLAAEDAAEMAVCGTGAQALMQVAAVAAVRDITRVRVWSPRSESRERFEKVLGDALGIEAVAAASARAAVDGADVVTMVTRAPAPFLAARDVGAGTHLNAVGAIGPDRAEFAADLLGRCAVVAIDDVAAARSWSLELRDYLGQEDDGDSAVISLADLLAKGSTRPVAADITLFKAMGLGSADLSIARLVYERASVNGLGLTLPTPARSRPRLRSSFKRST